ncbi:TPA: hypothetical protein PRT92_000320 [Escherichia coli]|nr:hypothetical protein [Escherichia coli]
MLSALVVLSSTLQTARVLVALKSPRRSPKAGGQGAAATGRSLRQWLYMALHMKGAQQR